MSDPAQELAALVADTLAAVESWRATGAFLAPTGPLAGLPPPVPWPAGAPARFAPRPEPPRLAAPRTPEAPRPPADRPALRPSEPPRPPVERAAPPSRTPAAQTPAPANIAPAPAAVPAAPASGGFSGLFGAKWQQALRDPVAEIGAMVDTTPPCPSCGAEAASLRGTGAAGARLAILAAGPGGRRLQGDAGVMLDKMLMHVLALERADAWIFEANGCAVAGGGGTCRDLLLRQLAVASPRLVLAMGAGAPNIVGASTAVGEWSRAENTDVLATFHPEELLARPTEKRAALEHLTALRQRL